MNHLYYGDNLEVLRHHIKDETVDLVYLELPFNSDQAYNVLFDEKIVAYLEFLRKMLIELAFPNR